MLMVWPQYSVSVLAPSLRSQKKAALQELEAGPAKHLALERFQAIHVALHRMIKLAPPSWENEQAIGIDVVVTRLVHGREEIRERIFFPKTKLDNGAAPLWLVNRKEQALLADMFKSGGYAPEHFQITGLRARSCKDRTLSNHQRHEPPPDLICRAGENRLDNG
jgi:hypothetical protein